MRASDHQSCCRCNSPHSRDSLFLPIEHDDSRVLRKIPSAVWGENWWLRRARHWRQVSLWLIERYFAAGKIFSNFVQRSEQNYSVSKQGKFVWNEELQSWHKSGIFLTDSPWGDWLGLWDLTSWWEISVIYKIFDSSPGSIIICLPLVKLQFTMICDLIPWTEIHFKVDILVVWCHVGGVPVTATGQHQSPDNVPVSLLALTQNYSQLSAAAA